MHARILSGNDVARLVLDGLRADVKALDPKLVIMQVGDDPASGSYVRAKIRSCEEIGMQSQHVHLQEETTLAELLQRIHQLNYDPDVTGFIVQLPLPKCLSEDVHQILAAIDPMKDIDGFGAVNLGQTFLSKDLERLPPATPSGVITMLEHYEIPVEGKNVVVVGRSNIVGKPLAVMLLNRGATVTVCHSKTKDLAAFTTKADMVCLAVGKPKLLTRDMVKQGAVVIDIGVSSIRGKLLGDADYESLLDTVSAITPVPGGVGPMTVASLIRNCVRAKRLQMQ